MYMHKNIYNFVAMVRHNYVYLMYVKPYDVACVYIAGVCDVVFKYCCSFGQVLCKPVAHLSPE